LPALIDRVAHEMDQRVGDAFDDAFFQLGGAAGHDQLDLLAGRSRQVAHGAREGIEDGRHRQHGQLDHVMPQLLGDQRQLGLIVADARHQGAQAPHDRVQRIGIVAELGDAAAGGRRQSRFAHAIAQPRDRKLDAPQLGVSLRRLQALNHHFRREMGQAVKLLDGDAQRLALGSPARLRFALRSAFRLRRSGFGGRVAGARRRARGLAVRQLLDAGGDQVETAEHQIEGARVDQPHVALRGDEQLFELMRDL
jgi:hypothetical protein